MKKMKFINSRIGNVLSIKWFNLLWMRENFPTQLKVTTLFSRQKETFSFEVIVFMGIYFTFIQSKYTLLRRTYFPQYQGFWLGSKKRFKYIGTWVNNYLRITTTYLQRPTFWGPNFNSITYDIAYLWTRLLVNNGHYIFGSRGYTLLRSFDSTFIVYFYFYFDVCKVIRLHKEPYK